MAPKNKFMKEEIICAALDVVRAGVIGALTAKAIADRLGVSTRPIFSYYKTMDEVKADVREAASELYKKYSEEGLRSAIPFHGSGTVSYTHLDVYKRQFLFIKTLRQSRFCFDAASFFVLA